LHNAHTSLGIARHWVGLAGTMAPIPYRHRGVYYRPREALAGRPASAVGAAAVAYEAPLTISELRRRKEQETKLTES
jgi:hypothetical protein